MCGIVGWVDYDRDLSTAPSVPAVARSMTDTLACRGPDDEGVVVARRCVLGHRRLSIIDRAGSVQPMTFTADGGTVATLSFCGEVYNFAELRAQLEEAGHVFRTRGDTEVVLHAYLRWGESMVDRLNGMYAFAVWDARTEELLLVRDRMGVKPLYYWLSEHGIVFGSEPKALFAHPSVPRRVAADGLCEALDMVKTPGHAVFEGLREVRPGELLRVRREGTRARAYWRLEAREHTDDLPTTIGAVRGLLEDIVSRQLIADVPLCSLLSGGLDSSAVTALAARAMAARGKGPVRSFSVDFAQAGFAPDAVRASPDAPFARELAAHVGARHSEVLLDSAELADPAVRAAVLRATDLPPAFWGDMWPSLYLLFRAIRQHSTVALSGESADELFGGYLWFRNPNAVGADTFPWLTSGSARYFGGLGLLDRGLLEKLDVPGYRAARYREALAEVPVLPGEDGRERRMREITYLNLTRFVQTLLDRKDRMSMAVGLEVRVPFCDHRLVDYVFNVPWSMKAFDGREKSLLRAATADLLPDSIVRRVKTPYPTTQDPGYAKALRVQLAGVLSDPDAPVRPFLDVDRARRAVDRPAGEVSRPYDRGGIEMALWLDAWLRAYDVTLDL
ncbi:asparagine synthase (glutamine-hydrolyzing) [Actinokineospora sp. NBRC 105648]|uniref:asparagine synthase (glutamine-hydrolyzing) n=1 Tax=Actinokineospora sp. NBRC 105648 TaxID=3032206 RepID=UPI0024A41A8A|nr:asparagine synthase (glutamine-hydrolyzing) [Actinokineospora sp. NBRC 105648]GLZ43740.1 asparagine synthetase B [Actinokineospora sp. NBRC 105648]